MYRTTGVFIVCFFVGMSSGFAATNTSTSPTGASNYFCDEDARTCTCKLDADANDCRAMLDSRMCKAPDDIGTPWESDDDARNHGFSWFDYVDCDRVTGQCTCNLVAGREAPGLDDGRPQAPTQVAEGDRPNEVVPARRGSAPENTNKANQVDVTQRRRRMDDINDGTSNTSVVTEIPMGAIHSEEAPEEELDINSGRDRVVDHRDSASRGNVTDHRDNRTDHRDKADGWRSNEEVPARRGTPPVGQRTDPSENAPLPVGLNAPSNLDTSDVTSSSVIIHWMDNSTREWGVELHRMDPVAARRDGVVNWEFIGNFEERRDANVASTGMRTDQDSI